MEIMYVFLGRLHRWDILLLLPGAPPASCCCRWRQVWPPRPQICKSVQHIIFFQVKKPLKDFSCTRPERQAGAVVNRSSKMGRLRWCLVRGWLESGVGAVGMDPQKSLSPSTSGRRQALLCPRRSHLAGFELGDPPKRVLIVALAVPAEMTDRGQFCRLTIIVLLITAMTFTGKPLQSHYLLMLNSATLKLHSLSPSPGMKPSGYRLVYYICNHAA